MQRSRNAGKQRSEEAENEKQEVERQEGINQQVLSTERNTQKNCPPDENDNQEEDG